MKSLLVIFAASSIGIPLDGIASYNMYDSIRNSFNGVEDN